MVDTLFPAARVHRMQLEAHQQDPEGSLSALLAFLAAPAPSAEAVADAAALRSNQAVRFRSVAVRNRSRSFPPLLRRAVGRLNSVTTRNPPLSAAAAELVLRRLDDADVEAVSQPA